VGRPEREPRGLLDARRGRTLTLAHLEDAPTATTGPACLTDPRSQPLEGDRDGVSARLSGAGRPKDSRSRPSEVCPPTSSRSPAGARPSAHRRLDTWPPRRPGPTLGPLQPGSSCRVCPRQTRHQAGRKALQIKEPSPDSNPGPLITRERRVGDEPPFTGTREHVCLGDQAVSKDSRDVPIPGLRTVRR
jgi:hypothetical protein